MRAIVIGGTRFTGPHVVRRLSERGCEVVIVHRGRNCDAREHIHCDRLALPPDLRGDVAIDMWCMTAAHAQSLAGHFRTERLVVVSSGDVYRNYDGLRGRYDGPPDPIPLHENAPLRETRHPYRELAGAEEWVRDYDKLVVEELVRGPRTTVLRMSAIYGPHDEQHRFAAWLQKMDEGAGEIALDPRQARWRWSRAYVEDAAEAIVLAALSDVAGVFNVAEPDAPSEEEWVRMLGGSVVHQASELALNFDYDLVLDTTAIRREFGYRETRSRAEALAETVQWERREASGGRADEPGPV